MLPAEIWSLTRRCFESDDGSLPSIELANLKEREVADIYTSIRTRSSVVSIDPTFWDAESGNDRALDDVPNAALLVATRRASPFHFAVRGLAARGTIIPDLGVHVFQNSIALDYRMGPDWRKEQVFALFVCLEDLLSGTGGALVTNTTDAPPDPEAFAFAWNQFRKCASG